MRLITHHTDLELNIVPNPENSTWPHDSSYDNGSFIRITIEQPAGNTIYSSADIDINWLTSPNHYSQSPLGVNYIKKHVNVDNVRPAAGGGGLNGGGGDQGIATASESNKYLSYPPIDAGSYRGPLKAFELSLIHI